MKKADVAVVGAGPAGSFLAARLAQKGVCVDVLERETFPRFHVGESLLPMSIPHLEQIGVRLEEEPYSFHKAGALFYDDRTQTSRAFDFRDSLEGTYPHAYQVQRDAFDHHLARRARNLGARVHFGHPVESWTEEEDRVVYRGEWGRGEAAYLVDATGQKALVARKRGTFERIDEFGKIASFTTFGSVDNERVEELLNRGHVLIVTRSDTWCWCIRLPQNRLSVGRVEKNPVSGRGPEQALEQFIGECELMQELLEGSTRVMPYRRSSGYSFYNRDPYTDRTVAVGDAYVFLDPMFSSAIHRALASADLLADDLRDHLDHRGPLELDGYFETVDRACRVYLKLIDRFYNSQWLQNMFYAKDPPARTRSEITTILAGDVWREDNRFQKLLLESSRRDSEEKFTGVQ